MSDHARILVLLALPIAASACGSSTSADAGQQPDQSSKPMDASVPIDSATAADLASPPDGGGPVSCTGYKYCENFEAYNGPVANNSPLGPWMATLTGDGAMMTVDSVKPYSGSKALHITQPQGTNCRGTLNQKAAGGLVPGNDVFGRAMVFYSDMGGNNLPSNSDGGTDMGFGLPIGVHSWIFNSSGTADGGGVTMNMGGGGMQLQLNYHPPAPLLEQSMKGGTITAGQWHCIQWQYDGSGNPPANSAKVWIDGAPAVTVTAAKGWQFPLPWNSFDFGFTHYQSLLNPIDVYLDDFALNDTMVPCP
jgi:hypothetical protein